MPIDGCRGKRRKPKRREEDELKYLFRLPGDTLSLALPLVGTSGLGAVLMAVADGWGSSNKDRQRKRRLVSGRSMTPRWRLE